MSMRTLAACGFATCKATSGLLSLLLLLSNSAPAADWPQFRGPNGTAVSTETALPIHWSANDNMRWVIELPGRGLSNPVISGGRVFVTACSGPAQERLHVLCFDVAKGSKLWERQFWATGSTMCHPKTCMAAPTPVTDGQNVYALFATGDLAALDRDGNLLWYRALVQDYPNITNQVGLAASPIVWNDVLLVPLENAGDSVAAGLDKLTGQNRWKIDRTRDINWVTPTLRTTGGRTEVLFESAKEVTARDPLTGKELWKYSGEGLSSVTSPVVVGKDLVILNGAAINLGGPEPKVAWSSNKLRSGYASPVAYEGRVYSLSGAGVLTCADAADANKIIWQQRVKGPYSASPIIAAGRVYAVNEEGTTSVVELGAEPRLLASNVLGETILATPAVADGAIYLRSDRHLYCIAEKGTK